MLLEGFTLALASCILRLPFRETPLPGQTAQLSALQVPAVLCVFRGGGGLWWENAAGASQVC